MSKIKSGFTGDKKRVVHDAAFRREAVRILATGGRTVEEVAANLGIGRSTLSKWKTKLDRAELMAGPHDDVEKELKRLRRENELLRAERDLLKKATVGSTGQRNMIYVALILGERQWREEYGQAFQRLKEKSFGAAGEMANP